MYVTFILNIGNIFRHKKKVRSIGCYKVWRLCSWIDFTAYIFTDNSLMR